MTNTCPRSGAWFPNAPQECTNTMKASFAKDLTERKNELLGWDGGQQKSRTPQGSMLAREADLLGEGG